MNNHLINDMTICRVINIASINVGDRGCLCEEEHSIAFCGVALAPDVLICLLKEEIMVEGRTETIVSVYWVMDSVECCHVGFMPCFLVAKMQTK